MLAVYLLDDPAALAPASDSSIELMRRHQERGHRVMIVRRDGVSLRGREVSLRAQAIEITDGERSWYQLGPSEDIAPGDCGVVALRLEPPVDAQYRLLCQMLVYAQEQGAPIWNRPQAIMAYEEKISAFGFDELMPASLVASNMDGLRSFCRQQDQGVVVKPLNSMGGIGVFAFGSKDDSNIEVALDSILRRDGMALVQERLPAIADGDRRVFIIDGKPADLMLVRRPAPGSHLGNMRAGGQPEAQPLGAAERRIAKHIGPVLKERGIIFAGIDVIGGKLTEINITCPTGLKTVHDQTGTPIADLVIEAMTASAH